MFEVVIAMLGSTWNFVTNLQKKYSLKKLAFAEKWDINWDHRQGKGDEKAPWKRRLIFIRHGDCNFADDGSLIGSGLTKAGLAQSKQAAKRIEELVDNGFTIASMQTSHMLNCKETVEVIIKHLQNSKMIMPSLETTALSNECLPNTSHPQSSGSIKSKHSKFQCGARVEAYFRSMFYRPIQQPQSNKELEIIVGHANLIRWFIMRALQLPLWSFLAFSLPHCSFTEFEISSNGTVQLVSSGSCGHVDQGLMPAYKQAARIRVAAEEERIREEM